MNDKLEIMKEIPSRVSRGILQCVKIIAKQQIPELCAIVLLGDCVKCKVESNSSVNIVVATRTEFTDNTVRDFISNEFERLSEDLEASVTFVYASIYKDIRSKGILL